METIYFFMNSVWTVVSYSESEGSYGFTNKIFGIIFAGKLVIDIGRIRIYFTLDGVF